MISAFSYSRAKRKPAQFSSRRKSTSSTAGDSWARRAAGHFAAAFFCAPLATPVFFHAGMRSGRLCVFAGLHLDRDMGEMRDVIEPPLRNWAGPDDRSTMLMMAAMPGTDAPEVEVGHPVAVRFQRLADGIVQRNGPGTASRRIAPVSRMRLTDQRPITTAPTIPIRASIQVQP